MIPKTIHYCWFGHGPLPKSAVKCIESWKKFFHDYDIKEWNESNYDVKKIPYISEAYDAGKYAFVSDYARFDILYQFGGVYFDTDVEVIKSFEDILQHGAFMGCETDGEKDGINVAPGLGIAAIAGMDIYKKIIDYYRTQHFLNEKGDFNMETVVKKVTKILVQNGLQNKKQIQKISGITIYPKDFFNPLEDSTGILQITSNTHSIHWYAKSWIDPGSRIRSRLTRPFHRLFGIECFRYLKKLKL